MAPKQEPIQQPTKVYESVQARGSVKEGVSRIEAKLAEAFAAQKANTNEAVRIAGNTKGPVGHYSQMKHVGKDGTPDAQSHRDATAAMARSARAAGSKLPFNKTTEPSGKLATGGYNAMAKGVTPVRAESKEECPDCECTPCECPTNEDTKHTGKYGTEYYKTKDFTGDEEDDDKKSKKDKGEKKGRGRPKKAEGEKSSDKMPFSKKNTVGHDLFGRVKATAHDKIKSKGTQIKGKAQSHASNKNESKLAQRFNNVMEGRMIDESGETLSHILNRFKHEVKSFEEGHDLGDLLFDALFDYYCDNGEMPYGTAKARDGDPYEWISDRLHQELGTDEAAPSPTDIKFATPAYQRKAAAPAGDNSWMINRGDFDQKEREMPTTRVGLAQRAKDLGISHDSDIQEENSMKSELDELARLAGLKVTDEGNAFTGKLAKTEKGGEFELDGKTFKDTSTLDEGHCPTCDCKPCNCNEGNEFSGELAKAKMQHKDSFEVDGKTYPVKEASIPMKQTFVILDPALIDKIAEMDATEVEPDSDGKGATVSSNNPNVTAQLMSFAQKNPQRLKVTQAMAIDTKRHAGPVDNNWGKPQPTTLEDIAKLSGIAVEGRDYGDTDFEEPAKLDNTPEEKIEDIDAIVHQGNDLNKEKKQDPKTANKAANPMEAVDPLAAMGRRLMQAYNSIKIQK